MISTTLRGRYKGGAREAITTVTVHGGGVNFSGNVTEATFVNGSSLEGLSFSLEKSGSFLIDYDVPKQDVRFQFINNVRVMEKPLNFTYTHWRGDNRTVVDGTLAIDSANKLSAIYGFDSGICKLGYSYVHRGLTTFEPSYDFAKNSWDVAVSQRVYEDNVVKASYQSSSKVLGLEWSKNRSSSGGFKMITPRKPSCLQDPSLGVKFRISNNFKLCSSIRMYWKPLRSPEVCFIAFGGLRKT